MTCPKESDLALYAGREAPRRRIAKVEHHVKRCPRCADRVAEFGLVRSAVASSGSQMPPSIRKKVRVEILSQISREPLRGAGHHLLPPILRIACVAVVLLVSASLVPILQPPRPSAFPLKMAFEAQKPPPRAFFVSDRPASSSESIALASTRFAGPGNFESAQLSLVETSAGEAGIVQLRIPAKDSSLEIHWIIE